MYTFRCKELDIKQIAESGQVFRMVPEDKGFCIFHRDKELYVTQRGDEITAECSGAEFEEIWADYFDLGTDYAKIIGEFDSIPGTADDKFMHEAMKFGRGIRILRQDPWEAALSFVVSQNNNIPRIKGCIEKICERFAENEDCRQGSIRFHMIPRPEDIRSLGSVEGLKGLGLGYRDEYIFRMCTENDIEEVLARASEMKYEDAMKELMKIHGIGAKVANCICLFGLHMLNACPIDVWMKRIIDEEYAGSRPAWMDSRYAGVYQQYAFYYTRER